MSKLSKLLVTAAILPGMMDAPAVLADDLDDKKDKQTTEETVSSDALLSSLKTLTLTSTSVPEKGKSVSARDESSVLNQEKSISVQDEEIAEPWTVVVRHVMRDGWNTEFYTETLYASREPEHWSGHADDYYEIGPLFGMTGLAGETVYSGSYEGNLSGTFTETPQMVTIYYDVVPDTPNNQECDVIIEYRDETGNKLFNSDIKYGSWGDMYTVQPKDIEGYTYKTTTGDAISDGYANVDAFGNLTGSFNGHQSSIITYVYVKDDKTPVLAKPITVRYVDRYTHYEMEEPDVFNGNVGETKDISPKRFSYDSWRDWKCAYSSNWLLDQTVMFSDQEQTIIYYYDYPKISNSVIFSYVDENGQTIPGNNSWSNDGEIGSTDTFKANQIPGYTFKEVDNNGVISTDQSGTYTYSEKEQQITFKYTKNQAVAAEPITVRYVDDDSKLDIVDPDVLNGNVGETKDIAPRYRVETPSGFYSYSYSSNGEADQTVTFSEQGQTITYYYDYHPYVPQLPGIGAPVYVSYVDEKGNSIPGYNSWDYTGADGEARVLTAEDIQGYTFKEVDVDGNVSDNSSVNVTTSSQEQYVTFKYVKDPVAAADVTVKHVEKATGKELPGSYTVQGNVGDAIKADPLDFDGYTFLETEWPTEATTEDGSPAFTENPQTVTHYYTRDVAVGADVTVQYVDKYGNKLADSETLQGNVGDAYTAKRKDIKGYVFSRTLDNNETGTFTDKAQTVTLVYELAPTTNNDDDQKDPAVVPPANNDDDQKDSTTVPPVNNNQNGATIVSGNSGASNDVKIGQNNAQSPIVTAVTNNKQGELPDTHAERKSALPLALLAAGLLVSAFAVVIPNKKH